MNTGLTSRSGDEDARARRRVTRAAGACIAAALTVPLTGLLLASREPRPGAVPAARPAVGSSPIESGYPTATAARVVLSANGTRSSPVFWQVGRSADRSKNAVLVAYQMYVGTTVRLAEQPDPDDIALAQVALDPLVGRLRRALAASAAAGVSRRGRVLAVAMVETVRGNQATVVGCLNEAAQRLFGPDDHLVRRWRAGISVSRVLLQRHDGRWKVYRLEALPAARCRR